MENNYDVTYFIKKFEAIPEDMWLVAQYGDDRGRGCVNNYVQRAYGMSTIFWELINKNIQPNYNKNNYSFNLDHTTAQAINNGDHFDYQQPTPKQRILAALYDIKKTQQPIIEEPKWKDITSELAVFPVEEKSDLKTVKEIV